MIPGRKQYETEFSNRADSPLAEFAKNLASGQGQRSRQPYMKTQESRTILAPQQKIVSKNVMNSPKMSLDGIKMKSRPVLRSRNKYRPSPIYQANIGSHSRKHIINTDMNITNDSAVKFDSKVMNITNDSNEPYHITGSDLPNKSIMSAYYSNGVAMGKERQIP